MTLTISCKNGEFAYTFTPDEDAMVRIAGDGMMAVLREKQRVLSLANQLRSSGFASPMGGGGLGVGRSVGGH